MYQIKAGNVHLQKRNCAVFAQLKSAAFVARSGGFRRHGADLGDMPHLAARPRRALAVEVDGGAGNGQPLLDSR